MRKTDEFIEKYFKQLFLLFAGTFLLLYLALIGGDSIWRDESYTFAMIKHSYSDIFRITAADVHPPLYYWYLKFLIAPLNYNMAMAKIASILPEMFIIFWGGIQIKQCFSKKTAVLFMLLYFCYPFAMSYSIEIRMYSLASAFVFASAVFAYRFWREDGSIKYAVGLVISGVGAAYTHYFALVSVCVIYGLLLVALIVSKKKLMVKWMLAVGFSIVFYIPWLSSFVAQLAYKVENEYWIDEIGIRTLLVYLYSLFRVRGVKIYAVFFSVSYLICAIWVLRRKSERRDFWLCLCCLLVPIGTIAVGVLASIAVRPVFVIRYVVPAIPLMAAFMAIVLEKMDNDMLFGGILCIAIMGGICNYGITIYTEYAEQNYMPVEKYDDVDAYIIKSKAAVCETLAYYVTDKPIYYDEAVTAANPYPNRKAEEDFDYADQVIVLMDVGDTPPEEYYDMYDVEYLERWKCDYETDAFLMRYSN